MLNRLEGWLPTDSRLVAVGERVFIGDHLGPEATLRARGLTISALGGRLFLFSRWEALEGVKK